MIRLSSQTLSDIEDSRIDYKVVVHYPQPEAYTTEDFLISVGDISESLNLGEYSLSNTNITLANAEYYFSRKFAVLANLPSNKAVDIYLIINQSEEVKYFTGTVTGWTLTESTLTIEVTA